VYWACIVINSFSEHLFVSAQAGVIQAELIWQGGSGPSVYEAVAAVLLSGAVKLRTMLQEPDPLATEIEIAFDDAELKVTELGTVTLAQSPVCV
jgi:hypothetical protein